MPSPDDIREAYMVTSSLTGTIAKLADQGKLLRIVEEKGGQPFEFATGETTKLRADKKVLGKKKIEWGDLAVGQRVRITFAMPRELPQDLSIDDIEVLEIKVIQPKDS
jgi:hypothetical protein